MYLTSMVVLALSGCVAEAPFAASELAESKLNVDLLSAAERPVMAPYRNILLVVSDDLGTEASVCYPRPVTDRAPQPNIMELCRRGVAFDRAWASPTCSPTRAGLMTGRHSSRTGVGTALGLGTTGPSLDEYGLPQALKDTGHGYVTGAFGKWHLSDPTNGGNDHPNLMGFDHFAGAMRGEVTDYDEWDRVEDGVQRTVRDYATSRTVDDALDWITAQETPWFAMVNFHAPHTPLHLPPTDLHSYDDLSGTDEDIDANPLDYYQAMVESMDTELGRLLAGLDPADLGHTVVIYMGDNGSTSTVNQDVYLSGQSKGSLYQGGVHVPLIIAGAVPVGRGSRVPFPVNTLDLFSTIIELAEGSVEDLVPTDTVIDSVSLLPYLVDPRTGPQRSYVVAERFGGRLAEIGAGQAIFDGRYKLMQTKAGAQIFYDLFADPTELNDMLSDTDYLPDPSLKDIYDEMLVALNEIPLP